MGFLSQNGEAVDQAKTTANNTTNQQPSEKKDTQTSQKTDEQKKIQAAQELEKMKIQAAQELEKLVKKLEETPKDSSSSLSKDKLIEVILTEGNPDIIKLKKEIDEHKLLKDILESEIAEKKELLKPVKRADKRLYGKSIKRPTKEQRKTLKVQVGLLKNKLIWTKDKIETLNNQLSRLSIRETGNLSLKNLKDKAFSDSYIKKNEYLIAPRLLKLLNGILQGTDEIKKKSFSRVRRLAFIESEEGIKVFNDTFAEFIRNIDLKTSILISGKLKNKYSEAARLTLKMWNPAEPIIPELVFPDPKKDVKKADDPFIINRSLISSLILGLFNKALNEKEKSKKIIALRDLAKDKKSHDKFIKELDDFLSKDEDVEVYQLGSGGYRDRLNETIRLTLLKWQPELQSKIENIVFAVSLEVKFTADKNFDEEPFLKKVKESLNLKFISSSISDESKILFFNSCIDPSIMDDRKNTIDNFASQNQVRVIIS